METVSRNAPCPCGSGQKYKRCHGKDAGDEPVKRDPRVPMAVAGISLVAALAVAFFDTWANAGLVGGLGILIAAVLLVFRDPPPPNKGSKNPAGLNFGN